MLKFNLVVAILILIFIAGGVLTVLMIKENTKLALENRQLIMEKVFLNAVLANPDVLHEKEPIGSEIIKTYEEQYEHKN